MCASLSVRAEYTLISEDVISCGNYYKTIFDLEEESLSRASNAPYKIVLSYGAMSRDFYILDEDYKIFLEDQVSSPYRDIDPNKEKCTLKVYRLNAQTNQAHALHNNMNHNLHGGNNPELLMRQNQGNNESSQKMYAYGAGCLIGVSSIFIAYKYLTRRK
jgi:hypothetical protein